MECLAQKAICLLDCIIAFCSAGLSHIFFILTDYSSKPLRTTPRTSRSCGPWRKTPALRHSWLSLMPNLLHWVQVPWHGLQLERHPGINACVSTPVLSTIHNWDQKGYIYIYMGYISITPKKKSQGMEPLSLCEGHHGWLLLYAVLLHDEVHQPMSRSVNVKTLLEWRLAHIRPPFWKGIEVHR